LLTQLKTNRLSFRSRLSTIQNWEELGVTGKDPNQMHLAQIETLTLDDLKKFVETKIYGRKFVISIVGDKKRIDLKKLKEFGKVTEVDLEDVFVK
jgi:zinc protease